MPKMLAAKHCYLLAIAHCTTTGTGTGPVGSGCGAGVAVSAHPAPRAGVTVVAQNTNSRCSEEINMAKRGKSVCRGRGISGPMTGKDWASKRAQQGCDWCAGRSLPPVNSEHDEEARLNKALRAHRGSGARCAGLELFVAAAYRQRHPGHRCLLGHCGRLATEPTVIARF